MLGQAASDGLSSGELGKKCQMEEAHLEKLAEFRHLFEALQPKSPFFHKL
jgi:hypothetical protein